MDNYAKHNNFKSVKGRKRKIKYSKRFWGIILFLSICITCTQCVCKKELIGKIYLKNWFTKLQSSKLYNGDSNNGIIKAIDDFDGFNKSRKTLINNLVLLSEEYSNVKTILKNINTYPDEILELVVQNPETIDYVVDFPENYPSMNSGADIDIINDYIKGEIPLFLQWDKRWGYYNYGNNVMAIRGCGPTALSMVVVALTGDISQNPKAVADFCYKRGYLKEGVGTSWALMSEGCTFLGLRSRELSLNENSILSALKNGEPIIASMRRGDFTSTGHYIVLTGVTDEGKILVNDSNSIKRSNMEWDLDVFMKQARNLWAFSKLSEIQNSYNDDIVIERIK